MTMSRWDPFNEMMSLRQAMNSLLEDAWIRPGRALAGEGVHAPLDIIGGLSIGWAAATLVSLVEIRGVKLKR